MTDKTWQCVHCGRETQTPCAKTQEGFFCSAECRVLHEAVADGASPEDAQAVLAAAQADRAVRADLTGVSVQTMTHESSGERFVVLQLHFRGCPPLACALDAAQAQAIGQALAEAGHDLMPVDDEDTQ